MYRIINRQLGVAIFLACMTSACISQKPAPYIDKSAHVYAKDGVKQPNVSSAYSSIQSDSDYSSSEIAEAKLEPIDIAQQKQQEHIHLVEEDKKLATEQSKPANNLTDLELEEKVNKAEHKQQAQHGDIHTQEVANIGPLKTIHPMDNAKFQWPVDGEVLSRYGKTGNKFNEGVNISAPLGSPVVASSDGKVIYIGRNVEGYGNLVIVKHDKDIMSAYAHLSEVVVERGAAVKKGESIGAVGQAGNVNKPQLHFSLRKGKKTVNPELPLS